MVAFRCVACVLASAWKLTLPVPFPPAPEITCKNAGFEDVAVHAPQAALGITVKLNGASGKKPQADWLGSGQLDGVDVPVAGRLAAVAVRLREHKVGTTAPESARFDADPAKPIPG